jgi:hypothetical protein
VNGTAEGAGEHDPAPLEGQVVDRAPAATASDDDEWVPAPYVPVPSSWSRHRPTVLAGAVGIVLALFVSAALPGPVGAAVRGGLDRIRLAASGGSASTSAGGTTGALAVGTATSSAMTLRGTGPFADLAVSVSQTKNLVNQNIAVSWRWAGADKHPTRLDGSTILANYMQVMQCWGDTAPDRTRCVYGGFSNTSSSFTSTRFLFPPALGATSPGPIDPAETVDLSSTDYVKDGQRDFRVPFAAVNGDVLTHEELDPDKNPLFGELTTNEILQARTRPDGTGFETFETLTFRENDGLGCADVVTSGAAKGLPRRCWLVVVPRGETEVDGRSYLDIPNRQLQSSPLSLTNWSRRIAFPLGFQPVGQPCPLGAKQQPVGGVETSTQAVLRWQPALCAGGGTVFSYTKLPDAVVESGLTGSDAGANGLGFLNEPLTGEVPSDRTLVYAPVAVSGVSIVALVERQVASGAPADVAARAGERIEDLRLTPRLVAKLLTHSYVKNVSLRAGYLARNPVTIERDPEFLALNPEFATLANSSIELRIPTGVSYTTQLVWEWVEADEEARDFVAGVPDPWGMRVNPFFQGTDIPQQSFPKVDPFCDRDPALPDLPLCALDLHPYVSDFFEGAQAVVRGVSGERTRNLAAVPPTTAAVPRQRSGERNLLGITDTATAQRFLLPSVKLRNRAGEFVAPTTASMQAAVAVFGRTSTPGVTLPDPEGAKRNAYPLTVVTYAVAAPNQFTAAAAKQYAAFVRYAAGPGQVPGSAPGTLPDGYAPMTAAQRAAARAAADRIQARVGPKQTRPAPVPDETAAAEPSSSPAGPEPAPAPAVPAPAPTATALESPVPALTRTPPDALVNGWARYAMIVALLVGAGGLMVGPLLPRIAERLRRSRS